MSALPSARLSGLWATDLLEVTDDLDVLDTHGRWAVALPYEGRPVLARFARWDQAMPHMATQWVGPRAGAWSSSLGEQDYRERVESLRQAIACGDVYQANLCRVLSAPLPHPDAADIVGLWHLLDAGNPSPFSGYLDLPDHDVNVATASPELFVSLRGDGNVRTVRSGPIKGTGRTVADLTEKDTAENIMIVDLVRNDLSKISRTGTVTVPELLVLEEHPGLVHLVSYVQAELDSLVTWRQIVDAAFPPGSVTGAPKIAARALISSLETAPREYYCGALGWVDADTGEAELAVTIRTFWRSGDELRFGTGAGITWGSDPAAEWQETELKAARLIRVAAGSWQADSP